MPEFPALADVTWPGLTPTKDNGEVTWVTEWWGDVAHCGTLWPVFSGLPATS